MQPKPVQEPLRPRAIDPGHGSLRESGDLRRGRTPRGLRPFLVLALAGIAAAALRAPVPAALAEDVAPAATEPAKEAEWVADFDRAVERARAEKKDLLVDFTGSDWCHWCIRLHEEVFDEPAFRAVQGDYVLVSLDFPRTPEAQMRVPHPARNRELAERYGVRGYPTVLLVTADGDVFGRTGYRPGGAAAYVEHLAETRKKGRAALAEAVALANEYADAAADARLPVAERILAKLDAAEPGAPWAAKLLPAARAALDLDPDGSRGLRVRALSAIVAGGDTAPEILELARKADPANAKGLLERAAMALLRAVDDDDSCRAYSDWVAKLVDAGGFRDRELGQVVLANAAAWNHEQLLDAERAKRFARKLKEIADPENESIGELIRTILGDDDGANPGDGKAD